MSSEGDHEVEKEVRELSSRQREHQRLCDWQTVVVKAAQPVCFWTKMHIRKYTRTKDYALLRKINILLELRWV